LAVLTRVDIGLNLLDYKYAELPLNSIVIFESSTIYNAFNMKFAIVLVALFAVALAAPTQEVSVLKHVSDVGADGFNYA